MGENIDLQKILDLQSQLQDSHFPQVGKLSIEKQVLEHTRAIVHETIEVERELNYKYWKKPVPVDWGKVKNEIADQFIFLLNECNAVNMSADELFKRVLDKQGINKRRQIEGY